MMSDFAGGASGFPMTFSGGKFTGNILYQSDAKERHGALLNAVRINTKIIKIRLISPQEVYSLTGKPDLQSMDKLTFPARNMMMEHERNIKAIRVHLRNSQEKNHLDHFDSWCRP